MLTVELFAGIGGFRIAADELGFQTVWANEIEEKAATVYRNRFVENVLQQGDIWQYKDSVPDHDLLTGGFPCQPFSSAGKKRGIEDPRGTLFEAICEILSAKRPKFFFLENVKRLLSMDSGRHFATILDALSKVGYSIEWRLLNAKNFGLPQNRQRIVIAGRLEEVVCGTARFVGETDLLDVKSQDLEKVCNQSLWEELAVCNRPFPNWGVCQHGRWAGMPLEQVQTGIPMATFESLLEQNVPESFFMNESTLDRIEKSDRVERFYDGVEILYNQSGGARMGYTVYGISGIAPALTCTTSRHYERYKIGGEYRRLTPNEYARLQGFPDDHCKEFGAYSQYALYGNAAPPPLLRWALERWVSGLPLNLKKASHLQTVMPL